jgi:pyridoxal phosphate enzyme (YggS family)
MGSGLSTSSFFDHFQKIRQQIPQSVRLIAVTKTVPVSQMRLAYEAGIRDFGENQVQEAIEKQQALQDLSDVTWHLIGHLQTNKARKALEHFDWIHSVDSPKLAQRLNALAGALGKSPKVCLQVKLRPDPNKYGWSSSDILNALAQLETYSNLQICGLMVIPPLGLDSGEILKIFEETRTLFQQIQDQAETQNWRNLRMQELSMGMSQDYLLAIQAGATMVRLGQALFGDR